MKIQKTEFAAKLNKIKSVVPKKTSNEALKGILVKDGYLIASNLEMTIKTKIEGVGNENFILPERAFDLINNLPDGEMEIVVTPKNTITIQASTIKNKYKTIDSEQFPVTAAPEDGDSLTIKANVLIESMRRVSYAIPVRGDKAVMTCMCLQATGGYLNFVGLDGHVLAWDRVDYDGEFELLIPKNTVEKLKSLGLSGDVQISHSRTGALFTTDDFEIYTRLVEGYYFKYQAMFKELPLHTTLSRMKLFDAITRAKMCIEEKRPVRFELNGNILNLSISDSKTDYKETVELQETVPEELIIGFNAHLVLETIKAFDCENIDISFAGSKMPMIVKDENSFFKAIVLPVTIN